MPADEGGTDGAAPDGVGDPTGMNRWRIPSAPPWLWLWAVSTVLALRWRLRDLWWWIDGVDTSWSLDELSVLALRVVAEGTLAVALLSVTVPRLRGWWVARRYGLESDGARFVDEVEGWLRRRGAAVAVAANLARFDQVAFVFPTGWRRTTLGLFGGFALLWRRDRAAAEAVLEHELAHVRVGDHHLSGPGSAVRVAAWVGVAVLLLGMVAAGPYGLNRSVAGLGAALAFSFPLLLVPVLWLAELEADLQAARTVGAEAVVRAIGDGVTGRGLARSAQLVTHPPRRLRIALLRSGGRAVAGVVYGVGFAVARVGVVAAPIVLAWYQLLGVEVFTTAEKASLVANGARTWFRGAAWMFAAAAALMLLWPVVAPAVARLWRVGAPQAEPGATRLVAGGLMAALAVAGFATQADPDPLGLVVVEPTNTDDAGDTGDAVVGAGDPLAEAQAAALDPPEPLALPDDVDVDPWVGEWTATEVAADDDHVMGVLTGSVWSFAGDGTVTLMPSGAEPGGSSPAQFPADGTWTVHGDTVEAVLWSEVRTDVNLQQVLVRAQWLADEMAVEYTAVSVLGAVVNDEVFANVVRTDASATVHLVSDR